MLFGPGERDHDSKNQYYLSLETPGCYNKHKKHTKSFLKNTMPGNLEMFTIGHFGSIGKGGDPQPSGDSFYKFLSILNMRSIYGGFYFVAFNRNC